MPPDPVKPDVAPPCPACETSQPDHRRSSRARRAGDEPRVLLIEDLDALGADPGDARRRAARILAAGYRVTWIAVAPPGRARNEVSGAIEANVIEFDDAREKLTALTAESWDHVILASASAGGGPLARWLPRRARWWPTGFSSGHDAEGLARVAARALGGRRLEPLDGAAAWGASWLLGWSEIDAPASRRPGLPLWDGDLVLALSGLHGASGGATIEAFATVAEDWSGVDLVAWSHPGSAAERRARAFDIELRVHHVGPAPRLAESSWLAQASAAMLSSGARISAALVLRTLAAGCPLLWVAPAGSSAAVARWLADQACACIVAADAAAIADQLGALLERGPEVERMIERGRALAARHDRLGVIERLHAAIAAPAARRAA